MARDRLHALLQAASAATGEGRRAKSRIDIQKESDMRILATILVAAGVVCAASSAEAQRSATSKITGTAYEYPYFYNSAATYQHSAYQHADLLREASSYDEPVPQAIAKEHAAAIRQNLQAAGKKYAGLRKMAGNNKAVQQHLDAIDAHHKKAMGLTDKVDAHVAKGHGDPQVVSDAMHEIATTLKSAQAEHEKLMQHFGKPEAK
jgi:hypothetical protein